MSKKKSLTPLGETEMEVLHHIWELRQATVAEVQERILKTRPIAYTTVMTVMKNLADKGFLTFTKDGASYVYRSARPPEEVRHSLLSDVLTKVFKGNPLALVQTLVRNESLSEEDRDALKRLLDDLDDNA